jgi:hypothetical protein
LRQWQSLVAESVAFGAVYVIGLAATRFFAGLDLSKAESPLPFLRRARHVIPVS